jgi:hypothetical protein
VSHLFVLCCVVLRRLQVSNFASASRLCKAARGLLPWTKGKAKASIPPLSSMYDELAIPQLCVSQLAALVLTDAADPSRSAADSGAAGGQRQALEGGLEFHRAALLKYLRQLPTS